MMGRRINGKTMLFAATKPTIIRTREGSGLRGGKGKADAALVMHPVRFAVGLDTVCTCTSGCTILRLKVGDVNRPVLGRGLYRVHMTGSESSR